MRAPNVRGPKPSDCSDYPRFYGDSPEIGSYAGMPPPFLNRRMWPETYSFKQVPQWLKPKTARTQLAIRTDVSMNIETASNTNQDLEGMDLSNRDEAVSTNRENARFPFTRQVVVQALDQYAERVGPVVKAQGRNICMWGICLISPVEFQLGDYIVISLELHKGSEAVELMAEIRHAKLQEDGRQIIGCRFLEAISTPGL